MVDCRRSLCTSDCDTPHVLRKQLAQRQKQVRRKWKCLSQNVVSQRRQKSTNGVNFSPSSRSSCGRAFTSCFVFTTFTHFLQIVHLADCCFGTTTLHDQVNNFQLAKNWTNRKSTSNCIYLWVTSSLSCSSQVPYKTGPRRQEVCQETNPGATVAIPRTDSEFSAVLESKLVLEIIQSEARGK
jgi:hypothetical protein